MYGGFRKNYINTNYRCRPNDGLMVSSKHILRLGSIHHDRGTDVITREVPTTPERYIFFWVHTILYDISYDIFAIFQK